MRLKSNLSICKERPQASEVTKLERELCDVLETIETGEACSLTMFHGSPNTFGKFEATFFGASGKTADEPAFFFCDKYAIARDYALNVISRPPEPSVVTATLDLDSVLVIDAAEREVSEIPIPRLLENLKNMGHQAIILHNVRDGVFSKESCTLAIVHTDFVDKINIQARLLPVDLQNANMAID